MGLKRPCSTLIKIWVKNHSREELVLLHLSDFFWRTDVQSKSYHANDKHFFWEKRSYLWQEKKENIDRTGKEDNNFQRVFMRKPKSYIKNNRCNYVYVNRQRHYYECLITGLRESTYEFWLEFLVFFTFINSSSKITAMMCIWNVHSCKKIMSIKMNITDFKSFWFGQIRPTNCNCDEHGT